jgi:hypothetical protein
MAEQDRETYKYLQIDRPVLAGGDRFLAAVDEIGRRALGMVAATALAETHLSVDEELIDLATTLKPLAQPKLDVYGPHDLKAVLLRRVATSRMDTRYNFNYQAASLTARRRAGNIKPPKGIGSRGPGKNAPEILDDISAKAGIDAKNTRIKCDRIAGGYDPILGRFIALVPKSGSESFVLMQQAEAAHKLLDDLSPRIANGANPTLPVVPFASLPPDMEARQYERLMSTINGSEILPVSLVMGGVAVYSNETVARQNGNQLSDD